MSHYHDTDSAETGFCSGCGRVDLADDTVIQEHNNRHDESRDSECPICVMASNLAAIAWDSTGTDEAATRIYRESANRPLTDMELRLLGGLR